MLGRETRMANDLFYTCSLIEYIARKTKNRATNVFDALGQERVLRILDLAGIYHSDNIEAVSDSFIDEAGIEPGTFDNVSEARYSIPSHWDIGKVYKRLALAIMDQEGTTEFDAMSRAYHAPVSDLINDYNSSFYYESPQAIYAAYSTGELE